MRISSRLSPLLLLLPFLPFKVSCLTNESLGAAMAEIDLDSFNNAYWLNDDTSEEETQPAKRIR